MVTYLDASHDETKLCVFQCNIQQFNHHKPLHHQSDSEKNSCLRQVYFFYSLPTTLPSSLSLAIFSSFHPFLFAIIFVSICRRCCCCFCCYSSLFICLSFSIQNCCNAKTKQKLKNVLSIKLFCCHASFELSFESITHTLATIYTYIYTNVCIHSWWLSNLNRAEKKRMLSKNNRPSIEMKGSILILYLWLMKAWTSWRT